METVIPSAKKRGGKVSRHDCEPHRGGKGERGLEGQIG